MSFEELGDFLKSQGVSVSGSIDPDKLLGMLLGNPSSINEDIKKIQKDTLNSINDISKRHTDKLNEEAKNINYKDSVSKLIGISSEEIDYTSLTILKKEILNKAVEITQKLKEDVENIKKEADDFNNKTPSQENTVKTPSNKKENTKDDLEQVSSSLENTVLSEFAEKFKQKIQETKTIDVVPNNKSNVVEENTKTNQFLESISKKVDSLIKGKDSIVDILSQEQKPVSLDESSVNAISKLLKLSKEEEQKLRESLLEVEKQNSEKLDNIKKSSDGSSGLGLLGLIGTKGLLTTVTTALGGFASKILSIGTIFFGLQVAVSSLIGVLGFLGKPLGALGDWMFSTDKASKTIDAINEKSGMNTKEGQEHWKQIGMGGAIGLGGVTVARSLLTKKGREGMIDAGEKSIKKYGPRISKTASTLASGTANIAKKILPNSILNAATSLSNKVSPIIEASSGLIKSATSFITKASQGTGMGAKILTGLGGGISKIGGLLGVFSKFGAGALGAIFKRIPLIGILWDAGIMIKRFMDGDWKGGLIRLASLATNGLYFLGPWMALIQIPLSMWISSFDTGGEDSSGIGDENDTSRDGNTSNSQTNPGSIPTPPIPKGTPLPSPKSQTTTTTPWWKRQMQGMYTGGESTSEETPPPERPSGEQPSDEVPMTWDPSNQTEFGEWRAEKPDKSQWIKFGPAATPVPPPPAVDLYRDPSIPKELNLSKETIEALGKHLSESIGNTQNVINNTTNNSSKSSGGDPVHNARTQYNRTGINYPAMPYTPY